MSHIKNKKGEKKMAQEIIITAVFEVESEAYQALSDLRTHSVTNDYVISQAALVKKENGTIVTKDYFDTGVDTANDTGLGGLLGATLGIVGGPIGMLLGGAYGTMIGGIVDASDADDNASLFEKISEQLVDNEVALLILAQEYEPGSIARKLSAYKTNIVTDDAAEIAAEVEKAQELQREMAKEAKKKTREEKRNANKAKVEERRAQLKEAFSKLGKKKA